jgi:hypothetical protein
MGGAFFVDDFSGPGADAYLYFHILRGDCDRLANEYQAVNCLPPLSSRVSRVVMSARCVTLAPFLWTPHCVPPER